MFDSNELQVSICCSSQEAFAFGDYHGQDAIHSIQLPTASRSFSVAEEELVKAEDDSETKSSSYTE